MTVPQSYINRYDAWGTLADRPAPGHRDFTYYCTDTHLGYKDTGTAWVKSGPSTGKTWFGSQSVVALDTTVDALAPIVRGWAETYTDPTLRTFTLPPDGSWVTVADHDFARAVNLTGSLSVTVGFGLEGVLAGDGNMNWAWQVLDNGVVVPRCGFSGGALVPQSVPPFTAYGPTLDDQHNFTSPHITVQFRATDALERTLHVDSAVITVDTTSPVVYMTDLNAATDGVRADMTAFLVGQIGRQAAYVTPTSPTFAADLIAALQACGAMVPTP